MGRYELLLFFHVAGAIAWIGLGATGHAVLVWADRAGERDFAATFQRAIEKLEPPAAVLGPVALLGTGVGLVLDGPWRFGDTWVVLGLTGYAAALALGGAFQAPGGRQLSAIIGERGVDDPAAVALGQRLNGLMWIELAILVVVLLAMTTKPTGGGSPAFWIAVAAVLAGAGSLTARDSRSAPERAPDAPAAPHG